MKMRKSTSKILSLVLVLSFVFSFSAVTVSAADTNEQDELVTFILEYDKSCEVYELSDGTTHLFRLVVSAWICAVISSLSFCELFAMTV